MKKNVGITNIYIDNVMFNISKSYKGTFSCDNIPLFKNKKISIICNLSKEKENGSHFVGVYFLKDKIFYFDSFGMKNNNIYLKKYLKKYEKKVIHSKKQIQHMFSNHCGFFCMLFILFLENKFTLEYFLNVFDKQNLFRNDNICIKLIQDFIKKVHVFKNEKNVLKYKK